MRTFKCSSLIAARRVQWWYGPSWQSRFFPVSVVLKSLKRIRQITAERFLALKAKPEATTVFGTERDNPLLSFPEPHAYLLIPPLPRNKHLWSHVPPMRLERERKDVRVFEELVLFRHSNAVEPYKHDAVRREAR